MRKKILAINCVDNSSSGTIATNILTAAKNEGFDILLATVNPSTTSIPTYNISTSKINRTFNHIYTRLTGKDGFTANNNTKKLIKKIEDFSPDIIHIHTIHDYFLNIERLANFLKDKPYKIIWSFHDCWPFTGKCPNYLHLNCYKWQRECKKCPAKKEYPKSILPLNVNKLLQRKKKVFESLKDLEIVCPTKWMESQVTKSIANRALIHTIYNGIDNTFFLEHNSSYFNQLNIKYNLNSKKIIFSMAYPWTPSKGLSTIVATAKKFEKQEDIIFIVAGLNEEKIMPPNLIFLPRLTAPEIISILNRSSVFFNPSIEESFGLTNVEAQARGVPVLLIKNSGGSQETIVEKITGISTENDIASIKNAILLLLNQYQNSDTKKACVSNAQKFSQNQMASEYVKLFNNL